MLVTILNWYILGVLVSLGIIFVYNVFYTAKCRLTKVKWCDFWVSIFSWLFVAISIMIIIDEIIKGFPSYGSDC